MATASKNTKTASKNTKTAAPKTSAKNSGKAKKVEVAVETVAQAPVADTMGFVVEESVEETLLAFAEAEAAAIAAASLAATETVAFAPAEVSEEVFAAVEVESTVEVPAVNPAESNEEYFVGTVHELSAKLNVEYVVAHGFARYLTGAGVAKIIGQRKVEGKRGRCASIYLIPRSASIVIPA